MFAIDRKQQNTLKTWAKPDCISIAGGGDRLRISIINPRSWIPSATRVIVDIFLILKSHTTLM